MTHLDPYFANRQAARTVCRMASDPQEARELLECIGVVEPGGHELLPDDTSTMPPAQIGAKGNALPPTARTEEWTTPPALRELPPITVKATVRAPRPPRKPRKPRPRVESPKKRGHPFLPREHGTSRGYRQHYNHKDLPVCQPCRDAYNAGRTRTMQRRAKNGHLTVAPPPATPVFHPGGHLPDAPREADAAGRTTTADELVVELDVWFGEAQRSPDQGVQRASVAAIRALLALRVAMDDLARAERAADGVGHG